jgi:hypothetical protein
MTFAMPMALPPDGAYDCEVSGQACTAVIMAGVVRIEARDGSAGRLELAFRTAVRS